jgi:hypothetical protein
MEELELNHTYLIQFGVSDTIASITPLLITATAYHIRWNNGADSSDKWDLKNVFHRNWNIVEDISDFITTSLPEEIIPENVLHFETEFTQCYVCHGEGTVPDPKSTAGKTTCPYCLGAKMIPKLIRRAEK